MCLSECGRLELMIFLNSVIVQDLRKAVGQIQQTLVKEVCEELLIQKYLLFIMRVVISTG